MASNNFINECKNRSNGNRLGKIIVDGVNTPITNSDNLQKISIDSGCYVDGNIIGSVYAKCLKANFITSIDNLSNKSIQAQIGVKYANLSTEYINMGKYTIERPNNEITANMSQITAYDDLYTNLDKPYVCGIDYFSGDKTVSDLYVDVCNQLGLTPKTTTFINSNIPISNNPFTNGEKNRTVLQTVAKVSCSFIDIDVDNNKIDLCWLSSTLNYTFKKNDYVSVEGGQVVCGPINCLIIKNSVIDDENVTVKDDASITQNGENSIIISEDYILHNAELRNQAKTAIWNRVKGMKYVDCKLTTYYGKPFLKLGNKIRIYTSETEYFDTYVLKHNFTYDGSSTSIIESPALTKQEIKTKQNVGLKEKLYKTQIDIDKQNKKIEALVSEVDENSESIANLEMKSDEISAEVSNKADLSTNSESNNAVLNFENINESEPIAITIRPINEDITYLYPADDLYPSDTLYIKNRTLRFTNITTKEIFDYELPDDLLYYDENNYDEFILENGKCYINKKVEHTSKNGVNKLAIIPRKIECEYPNIELTTGNYKVELLGYSKGYIYCKMMIVNEYTKKFATKVELSESIRIAKGEIDLSVNKKIEGVNETIQEQSNTINQRITDNENTITLAVKNIETTVKTIVPYYSISTSNTTAPTNGWSETVPIRNTSQFIWRKDLITYQSGMTEYTIPYMVTGDKGDTGPQGVKGDNGTNGAKGDKGDKGDTGATGTGVDNITPEYYLSTSNTSQVGGSWGTAIPAYVKDKYLWTRNKIVYKNPVSTTYTTPILDKTFDIEAKLELKIGKNDNDQIVSMINASANEISLKSNRLTIESTNFKLTKEGVITATAGTIGGFTIGKDELYSKHVGTYTFKQADLTKLQNYFMGSGTLTDSEKALYDVNGDGKVDNVDYIRIRKAINSGNPTMNGTVELSSKNMYSMLRIKDNNEKIVVDIGINGVEVDERITANFISSKDEITTKGLRSENGDVLVGIDSAGKNLIQLNSSNGNVKCISLTQTSLESQKKNFEKFTNALEEVEKTDIYKYHLKHENDTDKKHLGFVIGENYNYSKEITSTDIEGNDIGVDTYSMVSLCLQAIKELNAKVKKLESEIEIFKKGDKNGDKN